jgi:protein TonB
MAAERFLAAFLLSIPVTFGLFWLMTALIRVEAVIIDVAPLSSFDIVRVIRDTPLEPTRKPPPVHDPIEEAPPPPRFEPEAMHPDEGGIIPILVDHDPGKARRRLVGPRLLTADGAAVPLVREEPRYPQSALSRGIEGRVLVSFTITENGLVENARVIAAEPKNIFNAAALEAIRRWRYDPKIVNGIPVEQTDIRIAIPFRLGSE